MVVGLPSLKRKLVTVIPQNVERAAREALEQNARELVAEMKRLAPELSGNLKRSIGWTWGDAPAGSVVLGSVAAGASDSLRITVYAGDASTIVTNERGVKYQLAAIQEFGTVRMEQNPFFFPSYRKLKRRMKGRVTRKINKAIRVGA